MINVKCPHCGREMLLVSTYQNSDNVLVECPICAIREFITIEQTDIQPSDPALSNAMTGNNEVATVN
jgi:transcription elongation factor Elf1